MSDPKKGTGKHPGKNMVEGFTLMKTHVTLLRLSSQRRRMRERRWRKLKKLVSRLLGKFKF